METKHDYFILSEAKTSDETKLPKVPDVVGKGAVASIDGGIGES